jgi:predicted RNA binding protein YcfA (HicA-like mRNA interferase family)
MGGRLPPVKRRHLVAVLNANGLVEIAGRGKGGHSWFRNPAHPERKTAIPYHDEYSGNLLAMVIREAAKTREEFLERLGEL